MAMQRVATIGVYGFDVNRFFDALVADGVDLFCDVRARRGVRGREYAFANARRLEEKLAELEISYRHFRELAPTTEIRFLQGAADASVGLAKRQRADLTSAFVNAYEQLLDGSAARSALDAIRATGSNPVLLCVERLPSACHRSLVAARLAAGGIPVNHILP